MSKHIEKYPGLYARCKAGRVGYQVMYLRCRSGMTVDEALAMPVARCGRKPKIPRSDPVLVPRFIWDRSEWNAKAVTERKAVVRRPKKVRVRKQHIRRIIESDTTPAYLRKIRAEFCNEFIKTGNLNSTLMAKLKGYADEVRRSNFNSARLAASPAAQSSPSETIHFRDDRGRNGEQAVEPTAGPSRDVAGV